MMRTFELLKRCRGKGILLNGKKLQLHKEEIQFLGHRISAKGLQLDPDEISAIQEMMAPIDVPGVQRRLGMVQYLSRFLPNLAEVIGLLRLIIREDTEFGWIAEHENVFVEMKQLLSNTPVLIYYDGQKDLEIQCDACDKGLGATLMQEGQPIAFGSRALTDVEGRYAPIEKKLLAVVWAMERYHQYTFNNRTAVYSDHRPL